MSNPASRRAPSVGLSLFLFVVLSGAVLTAPRVLYSQTPTPRFAAAQALLAKSSRPLRQPSLKQVQLERLQRKVAPAQLRVVVIGCDFSDSLMYGRDLAQFPGWPEQTRVAQRIPGIGTPMFAAHDSTYFDLQMHRVDEYFRSVSFGQFHLEWDVVGTIVNLPRPMGWYGDPDSSDVRSVRMAREVIDAVDAEVDFSAYDTVVLIHAGAGSETDILGDDPEQIPSNYLDRRDFEDAKRAGLLPEPRLTSAEGSIEHVLVLPEAESQDPFPSAGLSGFFDVLGVNCFEFGLRLGMLSLTDFTPAGRPDSQGIGNFGLMGFGLFTGLAIVPSAPSAINRHLMGWAEVVEVREDADLRLSPMVAGASASDTLLVKVPINDREYWLLEYRLQDPNGDLFYSFADSNGNRVPDYYDADSDFGNGWPTGPYDPSTDVWESTLDSEWDYFMSENPARSDDRCMRAGGSGVYIYHVDERVIENSILAGVNTINADPEHKGVDVEEADGIQDLDSSRPSEYILGWDGDAWRGEGGSDFGPQTVPATDDAAGLPTGIRFHDFSTVVSDSLPRDVDGNCTGFEYRSAMTFRVDFPAGHSGPPVLARRSFRGFAPTSIVRTADLGTSASDPTPDGNLELVCLADSGRVLVMDASLDDWFDGDSDPTTVGVFAVATSAGGPVHFRGNPVLVDFDGDGRTDILAASDEGIIAFAADGGELLDGDASVATQGVLWADPLQAVVSPLVVLDDDPPTAMAVVSNGTVLRAVRLHWNSGALAVTVGDGVEGRALGPAALLAETAPRLAVSWADAISGGFVFFPSGPGENVTAIRTDEMPAAAAITSWPDAPRGPALLWSDTTGGIHRWRVPPRNTSGPGGVVEAEVTELSRGRLDGAPSPMVGADLSDLGDGVVFARASGGALYALDAGLSPRRGFPLRPDRGGTEAVTDSVVVAPAMVDLDGDGRVELLWPDGQGALHAVDLDGRELAGWPVAGPAEAIDAPTLSDVDRDGSLDAILASRFHALRGVDAPDRSFDFEVRGEIRVYDLGILGAPFAPVANGASGLRNQAIQPAGRVLPAPEGGHPLVESSVSLQPNPVVGSQLRVRVVVTTSSFVRAILYNLEGEEVARSGDVFTDAQSAFDEFIDISQLRSGMYVCRIVSASEAILRPFAVAR